MQSLPTKGLAYTKQALNKSYEQNLEQQLQTEDELQQKAALTNDFKEGVAAFLEKEKSRSLRGNNQLNIKYKIRINLCRIRIGTTSCCTNDAKMTFSASGLAYKL